MSLKQQLLLVSLLALMLPWAGCQFVRETESALRTSQQQMLASTARAIGDSLAQYPEEIPIAVTNDALIGDQLYGHGLDIAPVIDGYRDDWMLPESAFASLPGADGATRFAMGLKPPHAYLFVAVTDRDVVYAESLATLPNAGSTDRVVLVSANPPYLEERFSFAAEAPGRVVTYIENAYGFAPEPTVRAYWQDVPGGYQLEARIPLAGLGTHLGIIIEDADAPHAAAVRSASFSARSPGPFVSVSPELERIGAGLVQPGMRLIVTDAGGWRIASAGSLDASDSGGGTPFSWLRVAYDALVESGRPATQAGPDPTGRERQPYIAAALDGRSGRAWFRSDESARAIVAVAEPIVVGNETIGAIVLQQGTDAILSLTNQGLARLLNLTLVAMLLVAGGLVGYATWLSRRIRRLSVAAEAALERDALQTALPSASARDEIGDLSRSFSSVLTQLGDYNEYLRTLASKLSHELRTPLAIVTSSLENLEQEPLDAAAADYTARAKDGADRLRRILAAMSEANRVEELMKDAELERFDLGTVVGSTVGSYRDVYPDRLFDIELGSTQATMNGSPELIIQLLDKLVDNAVSFSNDDDTLTIRLSDDGPMLKLDVENPGPPLPERMQSQLFDSMVSVRGESGSRHLGLGLYIAKLIADGHGGRIRAENIEDGVRFSVLFPRA